MPGRLFRYHACEPCHSRLQTKALGHLPQSPYQAPWLGAGGMRSAQIVRHDIRWRATGNSAMLTVVALTHIFLYPDDWNGLSRTAQSEYSATAAEHGIELKVAGPAATNPNEIVTVSDNDFTALGAPYYFGPALCARMSWEHKLRELLEMDDPCFGDLPDHHVRPVTRGTRHRTAASDESPEVVVPVTSPPLGFAGGLVRWTLELGRSSNIYAVLQDFEAFPSGVRFTLRARFRPGVFDPLGSFPGTPGGPHIAVTFPDGRTGKVEPGHREPQPGDVLLTYDRGSGGSEEWTMGLWLSPLPPPGTLTFSIGWPEKDAPVTAVMVEARELVEAARSAEQLW
jgi:hypothetical protein